MKSRLVASLLLLCTSVFAQSFDWKAVDTALGRKGAVQPGGVYKIGLPRTDIKVSVGDIQIRTPLALGGWLAFTGGKRCMMMGDLVLQESEVPKVVSAAMQHQIEITAIHNHLLNETPRIVYMHVGGNGVGLKEPCPVVLARAMKEVLAATAIPMQPPTASSDGDLGFNRDAVEKTIGAKGKINGGVLQFSIPRKGAIAMYGMTVPPAMGVATGINFQPVGDGRAAITGDFVMTGAEVKNVMKALNARGIQVTALHSHMLDEQPRMFFMHFWAVDDALQLAGTLRKALDELDQSGPSPQTKATQ